MTEFQENLIECQYCSRVWDGFAQCPCKLLTSSNETEEEVEEGSRPWIQEEIDVEKKGQDIKKLENKMNELKASRELKLKKLEILNMQIKHRLQDVVKEAEQFEKAYEVAKARGQDKLEVSSDDSEDEEMSFSWTSSSDEEESRESEAAPAGAGFAALKARKAAQERAGWKCAGCYVVNESAAIECVSCAI